MKLTAENERWVNEICAKIIEKESKVIKRSGEKIPYTTVNGVFSDKFAQDPTWWTNGFWEGMLWLMYMETKDDYYKNLANVIEDKMDVALGNVEGLHHDVGFMWLIASVANYRLTGNEKSKKRGIIAANFLASRFNIEGGFITAWNTKQNEGWAIIDCMMNVPLLYWATEETGYDRFRQIGTAHADKTMNNAIRPDGSAVHIMEYDVNDGSVVQTFGGQGYGVGSSWTRGQGWGIYGFVLSYTHTREQKYLDAAKRLANYFIAAVADTDYVPRIDFRSPAEPVYEDTTAGAIAACGMIEISRQVGEYEKAMYLNAAIRILKAIEAKHADWSDDCDAILRCGSEAYSNGIHMDIIYGDYYFMEAMFKLKGMEISLW